MVSDLTTKDVKTAIDSYFLNYFANTSDLITDNDMETIKTALLVGDLTIRDYFMGMTEDYPDHSLADVTEAIALLSTYLPDNERKSLNTVLSSYAYRAGDKDKAKQYLDLALTEDNDYELAKLLNKAYIAGWDPNQFTIMAQQLHHKINKTIEEDQHLVYN